MSHFHFVGISGALYVTVVAFSIVFAVLFILTGMIYAMKLFAGGEKPKGGETGTAKPAAPAARPAAVPVQAAGSQGKVVAAITAAILMATGGQGRVLSITPASAEAVCAGTWRTSGIVALVNNRLNRPWNQ